MRIPTLNTSTFATLGVLSLSIAAACNNLVGLNDLSVGDGATGGSDSSQAGKSSSGGGGGGGNDSTAPGGAEPGPAGGGDGSTPIGEGGAGGSPEPVFVGECMTNQECTDKASAGGQGAGGDGGVVPSVCIMPEGRCAPLLSDDCDSITGDYLDDRAIILGSLFSTKGAQAATNLPRQQAAALAIEQINAVGGVPRGDTSADARPLVMVSCDESTNLVRAAEHLVKDLAVPAIIGPNTSQDTLDVSTKVTVPGGTVVITPTAVASSITALSDKDLTWLMVPSDVQRAPLMISQINALETQLEGERSVSTIKLGIVFRNDALGIGTRTSLNDLVLNGKGLTDPINIGNHVQIDGYNAADTDQQTIVAKYVTFAPDIVVLAGTAEAITKVMVPLEDQWDTNKPRPTYILIDSTKVPELLTAVSTHDGLSARVRGTGITPGPTGKNTPAEAYNGFKIDYDLRFPGGTSTISGMGPAHDAAYAVGLALAATRDQPVSGKAIAEGLRKLASGPTKITTLGTNLLPAFQKLTAGDSLTVVGSFGVLDWDGNGAVKGGTLEMWCIGGTTAKPAYQSSGLLFDIMSQQESGTYTQCGM